MQTQGHPLFDQALADVIAKKGDMTAPAGVAGGGPITPAKVPTKGGGPSTPAGGEKDKAEGGAPAPADAADSGRTSLQSALATKLASLDK